MALPLKKRQFHCMYSPLFPHSIKRVKQFTTLNVSALRLCYFHHRRFYDCHAGIFDGNELQSVEIR